MDSERFDRLVKSLSTPETRRGLLRVLATVPFGLTLTAFPGRETTQASGSGAIVGGGGGRRRRRNARHRHDPGNDKGQRTDKAKKSCARVGQTPRSGKRRGCCKGLSKDASGRCATAALAPAACTGLRPTATSPTQGLQEAINQAAPGATLILCAGTWLLAETVVIGKNLTLRGAGAGQSILDGGEAVGVLWIAAGVEVTLQDLTITKGSSAGGGGGIYTEGTLTLVGVSVTGNTASDGGGIYNYQGTLALQANSHVSGNTAPFGGGISNDGGTVTLEAGSHVAGNTATGGSGGGIMNWVGTVTLQAGSHVSGNTATSSGGGIGNNRGTLTLEAGSRVSGNTAGSAGGGIFTAEGTVAVDALALVCNNTPPTSQCGTDRGTFNGNCPNPPGGFCP